MLVNFDETGRVLWQNSYLSKELAEECLSENTIWIEGGLPPLPPKREGFVPFLYLTAERNLAYDYEPEPEPVYSDTEVIMQAIADLELLFLGMRGEKNV